MKAPAFQFYADDFLAGTVGMTNEERGLYITLLCIQWSKGAVSDSDFERLGNAMAMPSLSHVKAKFMRSECDNLLRNSRLEAERQKQAEYRQKQAINAGKRWVGNAVAQPSQCDGIPNADAKRVPNVCSPSPSPSPSKIQEAPSASRFEEFWSVYPKRVAKEQSRLKFDRLKPADQEAAIQGAIRDSASDQWRKENGQFIPNPATYINQRRWEAVISINTSARRDSFGMTDEEILRAAL